MEFLPGRPVQLPPLPEHLGTHPVCLWSRAGPKVVAGQPVEQGQVLADPGPTSRTACVSPFQGKVRQIIQSPSLNHAPGGVGDREGWLITIDPSREQAPAWWDHAPPGERKIDQWLDTLKWIGPWGGRDGGVGFMAQLEAVRDRSPDTLICVGLDTYPPYPVRSSLLMSFPDDAVLGTLVLADLVGASRVTMLASRTPGVLASLRRSCKDFQLHLTAWDNVYPCADPTLVVWSHTPEQRRLRVGANPVRDVGVMLVNPWTVIRVARWFTQRRLDLVRPMMIGWSGRGEAMTSAYAFPGQPLASLDVRLKEALDQASPVILGNPMADWPIQAVQGGAGEPGGPWVPENEMLVVVLDRISRLHPEPCISCGWCVETCPTGLRPNQMFDLIQTRAGGEQLSRQLPWCIDCGLCSHVCPSSLPLSQAFRQAKTGSPFGHFQPQPAGRT